jgi:hypothetical protein
MTSEFNDIVCIKIQQTAMFQGWDQFQSSGLLLLCLISANNYVVTFVLEEASLKTGTYPVPKT